MSVHRLPPDSPRQSWEGETATFRIVLGIKADGFYLSVLLPVLFPLPLFKIERVTVPG